MRADSSSYFNIQNNCYPPHNYNHPPSNGMINIPPPFPNQIPFPPPMNYPPQRIIPPQIFPPFSPYNNYNRSSSILTIGPSGIYQDPSDSNILTIGPGGIISDPLPRPSIIRPLVIPPSEPVRQNIINNVVKKNEAIGSLREHIEEKEITQKIIEKGEQTECSICLEDFILGDKIIYLPCFHFFHTECIEAWAKRSKKCPLCNIEIKIQ